MTMKERVLYHQIHPLKLATDIAASVVSLYLVWNHMIAAGLVVHFVLPIIAFCVAGLVALHAADEEPAKPGFWKRTWDATKGTAKKAADIVTPRLRRKGADGPPGATAFRNTETHLDTDFRHQAFVLARLASDPAGGGTQSIAVGGAQPAGAASDLDRQDRGFCILAVSALSEPDQADLPNSRRARGRHRIHREHHPAAQTASGVHGAATAPMSAAMTDSAEA